MGEFKMRRVIAFLLTLVLLLVAFSATALGQYEGHPNVTTWIGLGPDGADGLPSALTVIGADGSVRDWTPGGPGIGTWEPTGDRSFKTTIMYPQTDPEAGFLGIITLRIVGEVTEDGQTATGEYTLGFPPGPDGVFPPPGEYGPVAFTSVRMANESMGEVVGPWPPAPPAEE
jgi:hypothetical protein